MPLPLNVEDLLTSRTVESERVEFKEGWNPDAIYRSICAFANDLDNTGGGFILVGVVEAAGIAQRPVKGLTAAELATIQLRMIGFNNLIRPVYNPKISIENIDGQQILVIWVPGGSNRPYEVPEQITATRKSYFYYIRRNASSVKAEHETRQELIALANQVPFDDRSNNDASITDISMVLVKDHLRLVNSKLFDFAEHGSKEDVLEQMALLDGPSERRFVRNVALMMFNEDPQRFFPVTRVEIVRFPNGEGSAEFIEYEPITGPVPTIIRRTLEFLRGNVMEQKVTKLVDNEESVRVWNYPFQAMEETIANALFHRDYATREPVEIRILPESIVVLNYGGPDRSIRQEDFAAGRIRPRRYRNRRLGDFLKELKLTEGRATGIPTILQSLHQNNSPSPSFRFDDDRTFFEVEIFSHPAFVKNNLVKNDQAVSAIDQVIDQAQESALSRKEFQDKSIKAFAEAVRGNEGVPEFMEQVNQIGSEFLKVLTFATIPQKRSDILEQALNLSNHTLNTRKYITPLIQMNLLNSTVKETPNSPLQKYYTSETGSQLLAKLRK